MIDWVADAKPIFEENPYYPGLRVNLKGRQPQGTVEPGDHYEKVRDRLISELETWRHPETGEPIVEKAKRREEVYSGPFTGDAPDIVVEVGACTGATASPSGSARGRPTRRGSSGSTPQSPRTAAILHRQVGDAPRRRDLPASRPRIRPGSGRGGAGSSTSAPTILHAARRARPRATWTAGVLERLRGRPPARAPAPDRRRRRRGRRGRPVAASTG